MASPTSGAATFRKKGLLMPAVSALSADIESRVVGNNGFEFRWNQYIRYVSRRDRQWHIYGLIEET